MVVLPIKLNMYIILNIVLAVIKYSKICFIAQVQ